jgi:hypothetical protein
MSMPLLLLLLVQGAELACGSLSTIPLTTTELIASGFSGTVGGGSTAGSE